MAGNEIGGSRRFSVDRMNQNLNTKYVGRHVVYKTSTSSTMDDAKCAALRGCPEGLAVLADRQTEGRGQDGHAWDSQNAGNIYVTFVFWKPKHFQNRVGIQDVEFASSCAVLKAVRNLGLGHAKLKWKNDLWCLGHKLAGALVETLSFPQGSSRHDKDVIFLLGIGVNVNADVRRHQRLKTMATSVRTELSGRRVCREELLADICNNLEDNLQMDRQHLLREMTAYQLFQPGSSVRVLDFIDHTELYTGIITEIKDDWTCIVEDRERNQHHIGDGISLRPHPTHTVYVFSGNTTCAGRSNVLRDTLLSLLDTSMYAVKLLDMPGLVKGDWKSTCKLLVIGNHKTISNGGCRLIIKRYVLDGGSVLGIGSGCLLVSQSLRGSSGMESETLKPCRTDILKVVFSDSTNKLHFYNYQSDGVYQMTDPTGAMTIAARTSSEEVVAGHGPVSKGYVTLVGFDIERTYIDALDDKCTSEADRGLLSDTVFQRDSFFINILKTASERDPL